MTNLEKLKRMLNQNMIKEEQAELIFDLLNAKFNFGIDDETMKKLGFTVYDWAKPQSYMDQLRETAGLPNEMLHGTVFDYSDEHIFGRIQSAHIRLFNHIIKTLGE